MCSFPDKEYLIIFFIALSNGRINQMNYSIYNLGLKFRGFLRQILIEETILRSLLGSQIQDVQNFLSSENVLFRSMQVCARKERFPSWPSLR